MNQNIDFGYPKSCNKCEDCAKCAVKSLSLQVEPYIQFGDDFKLMLIGQDPTIRVKKERVKQVLMLNEPNSQLRRWLSEIFGKENFEAMTIYATNIVKCTFDKPPSSYRGKHFLRPYFENCKDYIVKEITHFKPTLVLTLGEPSHRYFNQVFDVSKQIDDSMKNSFGLTDKFFQVDWNGLSFKYSPSLHISTYRVAQTYGVKIENFKKGIKHELAEAYA